MDTRAVKGKGTPVDETVVDESEYSNEDASSIDVQEPASALKAACSGLLLKRLDVWLTRFPDIVDEFGLATWQELRPYAHMQPGVLNRRSVSCPGGTQSRKGPAVFVLASRTHCS